jgi:ribonuclease G
MEIYYEGSGHENLVGNIYKGVVKDVLGGLGSAFVDIGEGKNLFLSLKEINDFMLKSKGYRRFDQVPIQKILKSGQSIMLQVKRAGIGSKNPQGTTRISLAGRYWVFLPKDSRLGVSRRIERRRQINRLKRIAQRLKRPDEGLIARTAAKEASVEDLERDFNFLLGTWKGIEEEAFRASAPKLLYRGLGLVKSIIRDRLLEDVQWVIVDHEPTYHEILDFLDYMRMREYRKRIALYEGSQELFDHRGVTEQLKEILKKEVPLKGGGRLVIEETEALTSIDVNTGGNVHHRDQELAILNTNLEAAKEIPRQLRLRKISGIIIIDFVDMKRKDYINKVIALLKEELKKDRMPTDFIDITGLGLVEITRKREGESLMEFFGDELG